MGLANLETREEWDTNTWIIKYDPKLINEDNEWFSQYIFAFYWSATTMTTVGYGDITPANIYEAVFVSITIFISGFIYAYILNSIGLILNEMNKLRTEFND